jgi:hypothetical protein
MCSARLVRRYPTRHLNRGGAALVLTLAFAATLLTACGSSSKPNAASTTTAPVTTSPTTTTVATVGQQAFTAYQHAFAAISQIAADPNGRSTDPRLAQLLMNPWYGQVVQEINLYRLRNEVVKGAYSFSKFELDDVTSDGRVIFTDCQTNGQTVYSSKTGAPLSNTGTARIPEQVVVYHPSPTSGFKIADDNQGTATAGAKDACVG